MDRLLQQGFRLGLYYVQPLSGLIEGPSGTQHVQPKVMDVLVCLARRSGDLVERDAILTEVWRRATSEEVLTRCISELRRALGDDRGTPRYIQTVPKRGYRLLEQVVPTENGTDAGATGERADAAAKNHEGDTAANEAYADAGPHTPAAGTPFAAIARAQTRSVRALLIDDHALFREGLKLQLLELDESMRCLEAGSCEEALTFADEAVDFILLDYGLPGLHGLEAIRRMKATFTAPITVVSALDDPLTIRDAIICGAMGYIPKTMSKRELFAALGVVRAGGIYLPPQVLFGGAERREVELPARQRDALRAVAQGKAYSAIAEALAIPESEVEALVHRSFRALGVDNRIDAVYEIAKRRLRLE